MKTKLSFASFLVFLFFSSPVFAVPLTIENLESFDSIYGEDLNFDNTSFTADDLAISSDLTYTVLNDLVRVSDSEGGALTGDQHYLNETAVDLSTYSSTTAGTYSKTADYSLETISYSEILTDSFDLSDATDSPTSTTTPTTYEVKLSLSGSTADNSSTTAPVPEPSTLLLIGTGLASIAVYVRKKQKDI